MNGWVIIGTKLDTKQLKEDIKNAKNQLAQYAKEGKALATIGNIGKSVVKTVGGVASGILSTIGSITKSLITGIGRIALTALGVSTALGAIGVIAGIVGKAFSKIVDENKELLANIKYLVFVITNALTPVANSVANAIASSISKILNLLAKVITYVAYIAKAWFGVDILAGATVDKFKETSAGAEDTAKGLKKASKNAKDLKKQLAGFDEMNVLQDNADTSGGAGGGAGGIGGADFTAPTLEFGGEVPEWVKWIAEHKDEVIAGLLGIAAGLTAVALGANMLMGLGIGIIVAGVVLLIQDIIKYIQDPTWENFANILRDVGIILAGIAITMLAINAANPLGWILLVIAAVALLVAAVIKHWNEIKAVLGKVGEWIKTNVIDPVVGFFTGLWTKIQEIFAPFIAFFTPIFETWKQLVETVVGVIVNVISTIWTNIKVMVDNIKQIIDFVRNSIIKPIIDYISGQIQLKIVQFRAFIATIKNIFNPLVTFFKGIIDKIWGFLKTIGSTAGNVIAGAFKGVINAVLSTIETLLNSPINSINSMINKVNELPGVHMKKLSTFKFPRLAKGGIINQPGRGIMVGSAIAGEHGAEGVIPLTDSQQMALLGEAIGKYITVNANITNTMNGRVISRELQKVQNESDFAFNR